MHAQNGINPLFGRAINWWPEKAMKGGTMKNGEPVKAPVLGHHVDGMCCYDLRYPCVEIGHDLCDVGPSAYREKEEREEEGDKS
jgi:hypothetical protein